MALGIQTGGGTNDRTPIIKYNAKAGRLFRVDRTNDGSGWTSNEEDITANGMFVADLENIQTGWMCFPPGAAPDIRTVPLGASPGERPSDKHKMGFKLHVKLGKDCGGDVREFTASASSVINAMNALHDAYLAGKDGDKLPVVKIAKIVSEKNDHGTNYAPVFEIVQWVPRPQGLEPIQASRAAPTAQAASSPPATGSRQVEPPAAPSTVAASTAELEEQFG